MIAPSVPIPQSAGVAWSRLTHRQKRFVEGYLSTAGNAARAAELAGYRASNRRSLAQAGWRLSTNIDIKAALTELVMENLSDALPDAVAALKREACKGEYHAIRLYLEMVGFYSPKKVMRRTGAAPG